MEMSDTQLNKILMSKSDALYDAWWILTTE